MKRKRASPVAVALTDDVIDRLLRDAAKTVKEVEESLAGCFHLSPSARGMVIR